ncbi:MAG: hypothetical protein ACJA1N_002395 [Saprospiraceae bacterium]|jgi:hypothetical protein
MINRSIDNKGKRTKLFRFTAQAIKSIGKAK